jgi:short-subunit dehydrogenase
VLCPGAVRTPMHDASEEELLKFYGPFRLMAPEKFAERALRAVLRRDAIIVVPAWWKAWWYLERLSPALSLRFAKAGLERIREVKPIHDGLTARTPLPGLSETTTTDSVLDGLT